MKFRRQHSAEFQFTDTEEFILSTPTGFSLPGHSINDILYTWVEPSARIMAVQTRAQSRKRSRTEVEENSGADQNEGYETPEPIGRQKRKRASSPLEENSPHPLTCNPHNLWHLQFAHSSTSTLQKLKIIKSNLTRRCRCAHKPLTLWKVH